LRLLTPRRVKVKNTKDGDNNLRFMVGLLLGLFLLLMAFYSPALLSSERDAPQLDNLLNRASEILSSSYIYNYNSPDFTFYTDWEKSREQIRQFKPPLWYRYENGYPGQLAKVGGRALLAESAAPLLYPLSLIYYGLPVKGLTFFALIHLWLAGLGLLWLGRRLKLPGYWLAASLLLLIPLGQQRLDWLAALSWLPWAIWLLSSARRRTRLLFAPLCALLLLAIAWPMALALITLAVLLAVAYASRLGLRRPPLALLFGLFLLGAGMAGPQLFLRLSLDFGSEAQRGAVNLSAATQAVQVQPAQQIQVGQLARPNSTQLEFKLDVPPNTAPFEVVLTERYLRGWSARVAGKLLTSESNKVEQEKESESGREVSVQATAEGWQKIRLEPAMAGGEFRVQFRYSPLAFTLGLYAVFLAVASLGMGYVVLAWGRFYREETDSPAARRVAKNSVTPLFAQLFGKALDFGFALFSLRLLGPEGNGRYTIAVTTWLILATVTDFGLETLVTREVARDRSFENANRHFVTMLVTKSATALLSFPVAFLWIASFSLTGNMAEDTAWAIGLLLIGFVPGSISSTISALFRGYEKYEYLAVVQVLTAIIRVPLGLAALLAGWGVVGLAGSSVVVNFITVTVLAVLFRREIFVPRFKDGAFDFKLARYLLSLSYPLMLNNLINNIFFKSDALLLGAIRNDAEVGLYNAAYKFIDAVLIIPSAFTLALFPVLAGYAASAKAELRRAYTEGLRLLLIIGLPLSAGTVFVAYDLIGALGGSRYLPGGAICLQILIWFLPFSYVNGLTQYVLIALNKQRLITFAIIAAAVANIGLNLLLMPAFGYIAASAMTIVSELVLLVPFTWLAWRELGPLPLWKISWRPLLASIILIFGLFGLTIGLGLNSFFLTVLVGGLLYLGTLLLTRTLTAEDLRILKKIVSRG